MATDEAIRMMFEVLGSVWPRDDDRVSDLSLSVYARCLADIPDDLLSAATLRVVSEQTFFPRPAEIRQAAIALRWPDELTGVEAWGRLGAWMRHWPAGGRWVGDCHIEPPPLPPRVKRAVDAVGGLSYLRTSEDTVADRARFVQVYDALAERERREATMLPEIRAARARAQLEAGA